MKKSVWIGISLVAVVGMLLWLNRPSPPVPVSAGGPSPGEAPSTTTSSGGGVATRGRSGSTSAALPGAPSSASLAVDLPETGPEAAASLMVRADRVLATVNGNVIGLKDLVPLELNEMERTMTKEEYQSRLDRAIEMELTFQAATAQGVALTPEQKARVDGLTHKRDATLEEFKKQGITWSSSTVLQVEFEKRLASALMLQQNLVAKMSPATPSPDPAAQARYELARREILASLRARGDVNINK